MKGGKMRLVVSLTFFAIITAVAGNIGDFDEVWEKRAEEARRMALRAYNPNPEKVADHLNMKVHESIERANNGTRRKLGRHWRKHSGGREECRATNPIDQCWRCRSDWASDRMRLADCAIGFGRGVTGGKGGKIYVVTDPRDEDMVNPKPGTLRHAVIQDGPLWIIFARGMIIRLSEELIMTSDKTIDGRGVNVRITNGGGFTLQFIHNVIIHGVHIYNIKSGNGGLIRDSIDHFGFRTRSDGDGISIFGASNIWIDHVSMSNCADGIIDAIMASTAITISNSHFTNHNEVMLFGASDAHSADKIMQITVAFNHFGQGLEQRMPRCRWGFVHVVNNDYTHWEMYAIGGSAHPTFLSQGNRFIAPVNPFFKQVTKRDYAPEPIWKNWNWRSQGDLLMNGAFFVESGDDSYDFSNRLVIQAKPGTFVPDLTHFAGALDCVVGKPC